MTGFRSTSLLFVALTALGCSPLGNPCLGETCGKGHECLADRCVTAGFEPVPAQVRRIVLEPIIETVGGDGGERAATVLLGGRRSSVLYLEFDSNWKPRGHVAAAFLLLEPSPDTMPASDDVALSVWTLGAPWSPERIAAGVRPPLLAPEARGFARAGPAMLARVDVTEIVRSLARRESDSGIAVTARAGGDEVALLTGLGGGAPPRLDVYLSDPNR